MNDVTGIVNMNNASGALNSPGGDLFVSTSRNLQILIYADDISILTSAQSVESATGTLRGTSSQMDTWFSFNSLILNNEKNECMLLTTVNSKTGCPTSITFGAFSLRTKATTKFLGIIVNEHLG